jgi:hypothetical protein
MKKGKQMDSKKVILVDGLKDSKKARWKLERGYNQSLVLMNLERTFLVTILDN